MTIADQPPTHDMREADTILRELVALRRSQAEAYLLDRPGDIVDEARRRERLAEPAWAAAYAWADAQKTAPPAAQPNADYCRYGVCKVDEPHVPGCVEWTPAERAQHKSEPAPSPPEAQPAGWQPIETAPKDGTEILGARDALWGGLPSIDVRVCSWEPLDNPVAKEWGLAGTWHRRHVVSGKGLMGESFQPTHWMPLSPLAARQVAQEQTP
jgi:hypothetical protein